tara:strand:+ start:641 stop:1063 length:423 start_codon:yes stop_codon:yes gene_type:complete
MKYGEVLFSLLIDLQGIFRGKIKIAGASFPQILALTVVPHDGIEMSSLSKRLGLDNSTITRLIIGLEKKGWLIRKKYHNDNRIIKVFLTSDGERKQLQLENKIDDLGLLVENATDPLHRSELLELLCSLHWTLSTLMLKK